MIWRRICRTDVPVLFDTYLTAMGCELVGVNAAREAWDSLIKTPGFAGAIVERRGSDGRSQMVGFGASVFISEQFAVREMRALRPGLNARIISEFLARTNSVLNKAQIAEENAGDGLNVAILFGRWMPERLAPEEVPEVEFYLASAFVELHAGYRLKRMLTELRDAQDIGYVDASRIWRRVSYAQGDTGSNTPGALGIIETKDVLALPGSAVAPLFQGPLPLLGLRPSDQELLSAVLKGATDRELAQILRITVPAVKRRWEDIYHRIKSLDVDLGPGFHSEPNGGKRGPQKRHRLLAYLRQHPEELRPFTSKSLSARSG